MLLYAKLITIFTNKWFCIRILWKLSQTFVTALTNTPPPASQRARVWGDRCGQFAVLSTTITRNLQIAAPNKCRLKTPKMWWLVRYCLGGSWGVPGYPVLRLQILWQNNICQAGCWLGTEHFNLQPPSTFIIVNFNYYFCFKQVMYADSPVQVHILIILNYMQ